MCFLDLFYMVYSLYIYIYIYSFITFCNLVFKYACVDGMAPIADDRDSLNTKQVVNSTPPSMMIPGSVMFPFGFLHLERLKLMRTAETHEERAGQHVFFARRQIS